MTAARSIGRIEAHFMVEEPGKPRRVGMKVVIADALTHDDALKRAIERAEQAGFVVVSANYRATDGKAVDTILVYVDRKS